MRSLVFALCLALIPMFGGACSDPPDEGVTLEPTSEVDVTPTPLSSGREFRRMDIDQLKASMTRVSGGVLWIETDEDDVEFDVLDSLAGSLGKPDFLNSNTEELKPSLLFAKFLDDAASAICQAWVDKEQTQAPEERTMLVHVSFSDNPTTAQDKIETNLRYLLLRFHGRDVPAGDNQILPWYRIFRDVFNGTSSAAAAWRTVCVGMFTHPDFYTF